MTHVSRLLLLLALVFIQTFHTATASFQITIATPKVALSKGALQLEVLVTPAQTALKEITINTIVNATGATVASDLKVAGNGHRFVATFDKQSFNAGLYKMKVTATTPTPEGAVAIDPVIAVVAFKLTIPVAITSTTINGLNVAAGEKIQHHLFSSGSGDALQIDLTVQNQLTQQAVTAHQVFLRCTHAIEGIETYFVLHPDLSTNVYSIVLNFAALSKKFSYQSGAHHLQLVIGDASFDQGIVWEIGTIELELGASPPVKPAALYTKPLLHDSDTTLKALPEIKHIMRVQDSRPPMIVSLAFTATVLIPLFGFILFTMVLQVNMRSLFTGVVFVWGMGFLLSLGAIFVLFGWYWMELTMFQTLGYLTILSSINLFFGHFTLKQLAQPTGKKKVE